MEALALRVGWQGKARPHRSGTLHATGACTADSRQRWPGDTWFVEGVVTSFCAAARMPRSLCQSAVHLLSILMISEDSLLTIVPFFLSHSTGTVYFPAARGTAAMTAGAEQKNCIPGAEAENYQVEQSRKLLGCFGPPSGQPARHPARQAASGEQGQGGAVQAEQRAACERAGRLTKGVPRLVVQVAHKLGAVNCKVGGWAVVRSGRRTGAWLGCAAPHAVHVGLGPWLAALPAPCSSSAFLTCLPRCAHSMAGAMSPAPTTCKTPQSTIAPSFSPALACFPNLSRGCRRRRGRSRGRWSWPAAGRPAPRRPSRSAHPRRAAWAARWDASPTGQSHLAGPAQHRRPTHRRAVGCLIGSKGTASAGLCWEKPRLEPELRQAGAGGRQVAGMQLVLTFMCSTATQREAQGQARDTYRWYRPAARQRVQGTVVDMGKHACKARRNIVRCSTGIAGNSDRPLCPLLTGRYFSSTGRSGACCGALESQPARLAFGLKLRALADPVAELRLLALELARGVHLLQGGPDPAGRDAGQPRGWGLVPEHVLTPNWHPCWHPQWGLQSWCQG